jgi:hypothetical protein
MRKHPEIPAIFAKEHSTFYLDAGTAYRINHPELVMVGLASAIVAFGDEQRPELYSSWEIVDLRHIVRLERIEPASQAT